MVAIASGRTSPGSTLTASSSDKLAQSLSFLPDGPPTAVSAATAIEQLASERSSSVFVYDLAAQAGFGSALRSLADDNSSATVVPMQTRPGAGLILLGRLSEGTSKQGPRGAVISAFTTPAGLLAMADQLADLPPASPAARLVLQVAAVTQSAPTLSLSPSLAPIAGSLTQLPEDVAVVFSSGAQEAVDIAALAYQVKTQHVIHVLDYYSAARELRELQAPPSSVTPYQSIDEAFASNKLTFFDYFGDADATSVVVVLNGAVANVLKTVHKDIQGVGLLVVRVLRPWDAEGFVLALPHCAKNLHVLDELADTLVAAVEAAVDGSDKETHAHSLSTNEVTTIVSSAADAEEYLRTVIGVAADATLAPIDSHAKKLLFFSGVNSKLSLLPAIIARDFLANQSISARLLIDQDEFARPGGVALGRLLLAPKGASTTDVPLAASISAKTSSAQFVAVLDQTLLKTYDLFAGATVGGSILVNTSWTAEELLSNIATSSLAAVQQKELHIYTIDAAGIASRYAANSAEDFEVLVAHIAFLKLYLGRAGSLLVLQQVVEASFGQTIDDVSVADLIVAVWREIAEVRLPLDTVEVSAEATTLTVFDFNAVSLENEASTSSAKSALGNRSQAIKNILFPEALRPTAPESEETHPQIPALRPDLPERTFVVTTSVNRRLTPLEYDRNVFHMEFDTSGTGLKYAIGEALGVHGWNDEQDVLDFCQWYGADPEKTISIPVPESNGSVRHVRTVFQALQQQIDLFGRPPKSFYGALSRYAKAKEDRMALHFISSPEGSSTFKKLGEKDTVTFADVLQRYKSARPSIEDLCELVGDIKPRHYSIASSQSAVGDRVDLLIVTVEWATPSGTHHELHSPRHAN